MMKEMQTSHVQAYEQLDHLYDQKLEYEGDRYVEVQGQIAGISQYVIYNMI